MTAPAPLSREIPVWWGLDEVPADWASCVVTIGVFDGVYRGHARLIDRAVRVGRASGIPTVLVTFDPHPARVLDIPRDTAALTTVERRAELAAELGVDAVIVLRFTRELAAIPAEEFVVRVLVDTLHAAAVVVGANFTFGHRGAGDADVLRRLGTRHGFTADGVGLLHATDAPCSSTHVRECLRRGEVRAAAAALGRPHRVEDVLAGRVVSLAENTAVPAAGRYTGWVDARPVEVEVTADSWLVLHLPGPAPTATRPVSVEFLGRIEHR